MYTTQRTRKFLLPLGYILTNEQNQHRIAKIELTEIKSIYLAIAIFIGIGQFCRAATYFCTNARQ
jgi:hypothetical protein